MRNHSWVAYVPAAARWPLEVHVAPVRDVLTLDELNDQERWDLAVMYSTLLKRGNAFFDKGDGKGMDLPYIAAWHQAPIHDARRENYRLIPRNMSIASPFKWSEPSAPLTVEFPSGSRLPDRKSVV